MIYKSIYAKRCNFVKYIIRISVEKTGLQNGKEKCLPLKNYIINRDIVNKKGHIFSEIEK